MKSVEIVFTKSIKKLPLFSLLIRVITGKEYSHVAKGHEVKDWGKAYYQASEGKVNYEYNTVFNTKHKIVKRYIIEVPDEIAREIRKRCFQEAGKIYAYKQNFGILMVDILCKFGIMTKNPWTRGRNCSELLYVHIFKKLFPDLTLDENSVKPGDIEDILEERCKEITVLKEVA